MSDTNQFSFEDINKSRKETLLKSFSSEVNEFNNSDIDQEISKAIELEVFEKGGKRATFGEIREWSGKQYQKTTQGWVPYKGKGLSHGDIDVTGQEDTPIPKEDKESSMKRVKILHEGKIHSFEVNKIHNLSVKDQERIFDALKTSTFNITTPNKTYTYNKEFADTHAEKKEDKKDLSVLEKEEEKSKFKITEGSYDGKEHYRIQSTTDNTIGVFPKHLYSKEEAIKMFEKEVESKSNSKGKEDKKEVKSDNKISRRADTFFNESKTGKFLKEYLGGKFDKNKVQSYLDHLLDGPGGDKRIDFIAGDLGVGHGDKNYNETISKMVDKIEELHKEISVDKVEKSITLSEIKKDHISKSILGY